MQLISNSKQVKYSSQSLRNKFKITLNENLSQSGSGLAKIGTEWGSGEGHVGKTSLTASSSHRSPSPFQRLIHPKDLGGVVCLVWVYIMTWRCNMSAIMASDSPWVSSQVLIMCHDNTIIQNICENTHNIKFNVSSNKTKDMKNTAIKPNKNNFNFSSCLPQIRQQLQVLNAFQNVALAIVIERHMTTKRTSNN